MATTPTNIEAVCTSNADDRIVCVTYTTNAAASDAVITYFAATTDADTVVYMATLPQAPRLFVPPYMLPHLPLPRSPSPLLALLSLSPQPI